MTSQPNPQRASFGHTVLTGVLVAAVILSGKWVVEHHSLYRTLQSACYTWLQSRLRPPRTRDDLPIVIIDIQKLEPQIVEVAGKKFTVTPRDKLLALISVAVAHQPKAIGVDIDFSPNEFGYLDPQNDPTFFRTLLKTSTTVPIFLGIRRSHDKNPSKWLGVPEFRSLAADIWSPPNDDRKMLRWVEATDAQGSTRGPSMSAALARTFINSEGESSGFLAWALTQNSEERVESGLMAGEFLVDFSPVQAFQDMRITTMNPVVVEDFGWALAGKIVLIGDGVTNDARDTYLIPTLTHPKGVPGIYKHAAAAYTLIKAPLYELTPLGRLSLDFLFSTMVIVPVAGLRVFISRRTNSRFAETTTISVATIIVTFIILVVGVLFVHYTRTIWDDFLFVILALWLHRPMAEALQSLWTLLKKVPALITSVLSEPKREEEK